MNRVPRAVRPLLRPAGAPLDPIPPTPRRWVFGLIRVIGGLYRRLVMQVAAVSLEDEDVLRSLLADRGRISFVAFRHPSADDPQLVFQTVSRLADGRRPVFLYGRGVPVWGGPLVAWILPRIGAVSVYQGRINRRSMDMVQRQISSSDDPVCLAPEGQVSYRNYRVAPIQRGAANLALDAAAGGPEGRRVTIVPLALEFRYPDRRHRRFSRLLTTLERRLGASPGAPADLIGRLWATMDRILDAVVRDARRYLPPEHAATARRAAGDAADPAATDQTTARARDALALALQVAEHLFGLHPGAGDPVERLYRIRQRFWDRAFPRAPDRSPDGRSISDIVATEAVIAARWLEIADVLSYFDPTYLSEVGLVPGAPMPAAGSPTHARLAEYLMTTDDLASRRLGHTIGQRRGWPGRTCRIRAGDPRDVSAAVGRRERRHRIDELTGWLYRELERISAQPSS